MPCHSALIENPLVVDPDMKIESLMKTLKKKKVRIAPVVDGQGVLVGQIGTATLLWNLLPVSVNMDMGGVSAEMMIGAAPGIAKRLRNVKPLEVSALMDRKFHTVTPDAPVWEGVQKIVEYGGPLFVAEEKTGRFIGMIDEQSLLDELERIQ